MRRKGESVAIFISSPSSSDEDASDIEENNKVLDKRTKTDLDSGTKQTENNIKTFEETTKITIIEKSSHNIHSTKVLPIDPILILKERPSKPA